MNRFPQLNGNCGSSSHTVTYCSNFPRSMFDSFKGRVIYSHEREIEGGGERERERERERKRESHTQLE